MIRHDQNLRSLVKFDWNVTQIPSMLKMSMKTLHVIFLIIRPFIYAFVSYAGLKYKDVLRCVRCYACAEKLMKVLIFSTKIALALALALFCIIIRLTVLRESLYNRDIYNSIKWFQSNQRLFLSWTKCFRLIQTIWISIFSC